MANDARTDVLPALPPLLDRDGLPLEEPQPVDRDGFALEEPFMGEQAALAATLRDSLRLHRDRESLRWHLGMNRRVDFKLRDGTKKVVFPDLYVITGLAQLPPGVYRTWVRGVGPEVVVEFSTKDWIHYDRGEKLATYRDELRVAEYFIFDVDLADVEGQLEGWRFEEGVYRPIERVGGSASAPRLHSERLGLDLATRLNPNSDETELRAFLPGESVPLPTPIEARILAAEEERRKADDERRKAEALLDEYRRRFGPLPRKKPKK